MIGLGLFLLPSTPWWHLHFDPSFEVIEVKNQDGLKNLGFPSHFSANRLTTYRLGVAQGLEIPLSVIEYQTDQGNTENVTVYPEQRETPSRTEVNPRMTLWTHAAQAISSHASEEALYLTWWDNAQRIHFLTGEATSSRLPAAESLSGLPWSDFWKRAAGGVALDPAAAQQLARWLTMDARLALESIRTELKSSKSLYLLACVDDLARLGEIERLAGVSLPLDARYFPAGQNLHAQIKEVRQWASETGNGANYLVQPVHGGGVRAWRVTRSEGANLLLIRLLPFTKSLETPLEGARLVYQSHWGGYISIHELIAASP